MLTLPPSTRIFLATSRVDGRKGIDGLAALVRAQFAQGPLLRVVLAVERVPRTHAPSEIPAVFLPALAHAGSVEVWIGKWGQRAARLPPKSPRPEA